VRFGVVFERRPDRVRRQSQQRGMIESPGLAEGQTLLVHHLVEHRVERLAVDPGDGAGNGQQGGPAGARRAAAGRLGGMAGKGQGTGKLPRPGTGVYP
jgi:hypothetical protein